MVHKIFIGSIPGDADPDKLLEMLKKHADVQKVKLEYQKKNGVKICKGFGFAVCSSQKEVSKLLQNQANLFFRDRLVSLRQFQAGDQLKENRVDFNVRRIFVGNVPESTKETQIKDIFSPHGQIENVYFVKNSESDGNKYGYIVFTDPASASSALSASTPFLLEGNPLRVEEFGGKRANWAKAKKEKEGDPDQPTTHKGPEIELASPPDSVSKDKPSKESSKTQVKEIYPNAEEVSSSPRDGSESKLFLGFASPSFSQKSEEEKRGPFLLVSKSYKIISQSISEGAKPQTNGPRKEGYREITVEQDSAIIKLTAEDSKCVKEGQVSRVQPDSSRDQTDLIRNIAFNHWPENLRFSFSFRPAAYRF